MAFPSFITKDDEGAVRPPLCAAAPLLWSLLPLIAGILCAKAGIAWLGVALSAGLLWGTVHCSRKTLSIFLLSFLAGYLLYHWHTPDPDPSWGWRPAREAVVELEVREVFNARKPGRVAGIGYIRSVDLPVDSASGNESAYYLDGEGLVKGEVVRIRAALTWLPRLEEHDDYQRYLTGRDIYLTLNQGTVLERVARPPAAERLRQEMYRFCQDILTAGSRLPADPGNTLASMLLGNRSLLTDARIELYRKTGTYHLFAVSGLHVGSVAACLYLLLRLARLRAGWQLAAALAGTWLYVWLTGSSPSAVRAGIMISCIGLSRVAGRQPHPFPGLVLSAWLVLLIDPGQLFQLGFQLSYAVVASILLVGLPMARLARDWLGQRQGRGRGAVAERMTRLANGCSDLVWISLSASLASMPLIIQHFQLFTPGGVLFGMLLNPLASFCVMAGCIAMLMGPFAGPLAAGTVAVMAWPAVRAMEWLLQRCLEIPGAVDERAWAWEPAGTLLVVCVLAVAWALQRERMGGRKGGPLTHFIPHVIVAAAVMMFTR